MAHVDTYKDAILELLSSTGGATFDYIKARLVNSDPMLALDVLYDLMYMRLDGIVCYDKELDVWTTTEEL